MHRCYCVRQTHRDVLECRCLDLCLETGTAVRYGERRPQLATSWSYRADEGSAGGIYDYGMLEMLDIGKMNSVVR